jgi:prepilin-type N-terminal cleavage/methylation domain-containing protein
VKHQVRRERGLTLIELIVVMAILVVLAGLTLPKLDQFKLKANKAQAASNMETLGNAIASYRAQKDVYPDVYNSLLETGTTSFYGKLHPSLTGGAGGTATKCALSTLSADEVTSLARVGITQVVDHDPAAEIPNNSDILAGAGVPRTFATGDTVVIPNLLDPDGQKIVRQYYPSLNGAIPSGKKVVILGVGRSNAMVGDTIQNAPFYANANQLTQYTRMLAVYEVSSSAGRARFLGALSADGDPFEEEIQDFYEL